MLLAVFAPLIRALVQVLSAGLYALWQGFAYLARHSFSLLASLLSLPARNTPTTALLGCAFSTCVYVGFLYVWRGLPRDHPSTIKRRMLSAGAACCVSWLPLAISMSAPAYNQVSLSAFRPETLPAALGLHVPHLTRLLLAIIRTLLHTTVLFALPLVHKVLKDGPGIKARIEQWWSQLRIAFRLRDRARLAGVLLQPFHDQHLWVWRNLVAAPVTEEFVFRACMAPLLLRAGFSIGVTIFVTPLFFGSAHLHHVGELVKYQHMRWQAALITVLVQFSYTSVFGWYATWLFLRSDSLWCPVASHALCNWIGVPDFRALGHRFGVTQMYTGTIISITAFIGVLMWPSNGPR